MRRLFSRLERRFIKAKLAKSSPDQLIAMGQKWLLPSFQRAARRSPAYRVLLSEAGVTAASIRSAEDFLHLCPLLEKNNTFKRFGVDQLICDDVRPDDLASVLTSSGHGAGGFALGMSTRKQHDGAARLIDLGLEMAFDIDSHRTLLINCLPMGVMFNSNVVCVANVSVREDMACAIVRQAGSLFEQIIICGDPLFFKRFCDYSQSVGIDWHRYRIHAIVGEETFSETFRDYLGSVINVDPNSPSSGLIGSSMGVGELGLNLFNETRESIALRRACGANPQLLRELTGVDLAVAPLPTFMVFNPLRSFVEVINCDEHGVGDLVVTVMDETVPIPLMRYCTGDRAQLLSHEKVRAAMQGISLPNAPMIALHGRAKDRLPNGGHVDLFKEALYRFPEVAKEVSGAHRIVPSDGSICWNVQLARDSKAPHEQISSRLHAEVSPRLGGQALDVNVQDYDSFPFGKTIDYERKFVYWVPPT